jgi:hypothetical protein
MAASTNAIDVMKHEEELKEVYNRLPFLKIIAEN